MESVAKIKELLSRKDGTAIKGTWDRAMPVATKHQIKSSEDQLGFALDHELVELFTTIGNGGFGPHYGLLGVDGGYSDEYDGNAVKHYLDWKSNWEKVEGPEFWPEGLLPICSYGCAIYFCIDCVNSPGDIVLLREENRGTNGPWTDAFLVVANSLDEWLLAELSGEDTLRIGEPYDFGFDEEDELEEDD